MPPQKTADNLCEIPDKRLSSHSEKQIQPKPKKNEKLFFCALAAIVSLQVASAQKRGEMYVGGSLGVTTASASIDGVSASATTFGFAPEFGYFVADRLRLSGSIAYNLTSSGDTSHALTIGPSVAYYVRLCDRFYYTPEAGIGFAYASAYGANGYGFATGLKFGAFEFRPASHCGISFSLLSLQYTYLSYSSGGYSASGNNVQFDFGVSPTIGFKYYF